jgi:hypothetical protein
MSPLGVASSEYINYLGGLDSRYIAGQWENDLVMRAYANTAKCYIYEDVIINIDHANKHKANDDFKGGYNEDRETLENSWVIGGYQPHPEAFIANTGKHGTPPFWYRPITNYEVTLKRNDNFCPYPAEISLTESIKPCGIWR